MVAAAKACVRARRTPGPQTVSAVRRPVALLGVLRTVGSDARGVASNTKAAGIPPPSSFLSPLCFTGLLSDLSLHFFFVGVCVCLCERVRVFGWLVSRVRPLC